MVGLSAYQQALLCSDLVALLALLETSSRSCLSVRIVPALSQLRKTPYLSLTVAIGRQTGTGATSLNHRTTQTQLPRARLTPQHVRFPYSLPLFLQTRLTVFGFPVFSPARLPRRPVTFTTPTEDILRRSCACRSTRTGPRSPRARWTTRPGDTGAGTEVTSMC